MSHVRQQLRESVAAVVTGLPVTGGRVFKNRIYQLGENDLPCLMIASDGDSIEPLTIHYPYEQQRSTRISIDAYVKAVSGYDDTLDTICKEVETAIANVSVGLAKGLYLRGTQIEFDQGEQPIGRARMVFVKDIYTVSNDPETAL